MAGKGAFLKSIKLLKLNLMFSFGNFFHLF